MRPVPVHVVGGDVIVETGIVLTTGHVHVALVLRVGDGRMREVDPGVDNGDNTRAAVYLVECILGDTGARNAHVQIRLLIAIDDEARDHVERGDAIETLDRDVGHAAC